MSANFQDILLGTLRRERIPVTVFLVNSFQIRGVVRAYDNFVIILDVDGKQQMVYKHAISTIVPAKTAINITDCSGEE